MRSLKSPNQNDTGLNLTNEAPKNKRNLIVYTCKDEVSSKIQELASLLSKVPKDFVKVFKLVFDRINTFQSLCKINTDRSVTRGTVKLNYVGTHFLNELLVALRASDFDIALSLFHKYTPVKLEGYKNDLN